MKRALILFLGLGLFGATAWADSITFGGTVVVSGNGFGNDPRALTIQSHGPATNTESGCIGAGLSSGAGACAPGDGVVGGAEANPISFPKQAAPSLSSLGISSGSQIGILFDAVQPQNANNATVNINDLTLKLYNGSSLVYTVSGSFSNLATNPGNGQSEYLFTLDSSAVNAFDAALQGNFADTIALDSTISFPNQSAGADSYSLVNFAPGSLTSPTSLTSPAPEPGSLVLLGTALLGGAGALRRRFLRA